MGCKNCKEKNQNTTTDDSRPTFEVNNIMSSEGLDPFDSSFLLKVGMFVILIAALPFILLILAFQIFINFFLPKKVTKINGAIKSFFRRNINKIVVWKVEKEEKKRENQFQDNRDYEEESELLDIEVYEDNKEKEVN